MNVNPQKDNVLVEMDVLKDETRNGVIILKDTTAQRVRVATVLSVGPGKRDPKTGARIPVGVERGERVAFFRWNQEHLQGKQLQRVFGELGDNVALVNESDILFAFSGDLKVE